MAIVQVMDEPQDQCRRADAGEIDDQTRLTKLFIGRAHVYPLLLKVGER